MLEERCKPSGEGLPSKVRVSLGSAILLGLTKGVLKVKPTTIYLLTYYHGKCSACCSFCPQSRSSRSRSDMLSRVVWPVFPLDKVLVRIKRLKGGGEIKRICLQAMNYPNMFRESLRMIRKIHSENSLPISISCQPLSYDRIIELAEAGIDRIGIPLDASTREIFKRVKGSLIMGPYIWERHIEALKTSVEILGGGKVSTHLIVGLGEKDIELLKQVQNMIDLGVYPGLFSFTPIPGTPLESEKSPSIQRYRKVQLMHYLITSGKIRLGDVTFDEEGSIKSVNFNKQCLKDIITTGIPFMTSGCEGCNRPYYNERPSGPIYNFPEGPNKWELDQIEKDLGGDLIKG